MTSLTLKRAREDAGLTAAEVASRTRLSPRIVAAIEAERYDLLPAGLYARTAVRAYAQAVNIAPDLVIAELRSKLPEAPLDLAEVAALRAPAARLRRHHYALAAALDAAILLSIDAVIVRVCATACGQQPFELLATAAGSMAILCAAPIVFYFWLLGATDVRTAGPWLFDVEILPPFDGPLSFETWWRRGFVYLRRELQLASGLVEKSGGALVCEHHR